MVASFALAMASPHSFAETVSALCPSDLKPLHAVPPKLPAETETGYEGKAVIAITVNRNGSVSTPSIVSNGLRAVFGGDARAFDGALLDAVKQWKFHPRQHACHKDVTIELKFSE
jgi:TonB family protein